MAPNRCAAGFADATQLTVDGWQGICEQLPLHASARELDAVLEQFGMLDPDERAALWLYAWSQQAHDPEWVGRR